MTGLRDRIEGLRDGDGAVLIGTLLSIVWLLMVAGFWLFGPAGDGRPGGLVRLVSAFGVLMPLVLIWLAVGTARAIAALRTEADDLRSRLTAMRAATANGGIRVPPATESAQTQAPPPPPAAAAARPRPTDTRQTAMRFESPERVAIGSADLIRALNFPDGPDDLRAVEALRSALRDHDTARLIRASQDVITLLAENDIYMDNLPPDPAPAAIWRRFAEGGRGSAVSALGGIHDPMALDIAMAMLKGDEIFRDSAHHFLRHFDLAVTRLIPTLTDDEIADLAQTRSARAFMLLGRAMGVFG